MNPRTFGVEEELLLVDPHSGEPLAVSPAVLRSARRPDEPAATEPDGGPATDFEAELQREQLETATRPCDSLAELAEQVTRARHAAARAAHRIGAEVAALATSPLPVTPKLTPTSRYRRMAEEYAITADEQLTCGCHVHVGIESAAEGVGVLDRIRGWLPTLLALSANSPFWQGRDTGYQSFRQQVWGRWPSSGPPGVFGTEAVYHATVKAMIDSGAMLDEGMVYFDARLSRRHPTVEIRVADVCMSAADTVLVAALSRALVETAVRSWAAGEEPDRTRTEVLRLAGWRASRSGLAEELVHPPTGRPAPAHAVVHALVDHVRPALADAGDLDTVERLLGDLLIRGNGADQQREVYGRSGEPAAVVADAVARTLDC